MSRVIEKTTYNYTHATDVKPERLASVEGKEPQGEVTVKVLQSGDDILMLEVFRAKGLIDPMHRHDDHETTGYLIKGKMRVVIDGEEFIALPGTSWIHRRGVDHFSEALEDCLQLEIKSPPVKTWKTK